MDVLREIQALAKLERKTWRAKLNELILSGTPTAAWLKTRVGTFYDKEILKYVTGIEATRNVVIDSTTVPVDPVSGRYVCQAGTLLVNNTAVAGQPTIQTLSLPSDATQGGFQLVVPPFGTAAGGAGLTAELGDNPTAAQIQDALAELPDIGEGNVTVTEAAGVAPAANVFTVTFEGVLAGANIPQIQIVNNTLDGTAPAASAVTQVGRAADATGKVAPAPAAGVTAGQVVGILTHTVEFFYPVEPNVTDEPAAAYFHLCVFDSTKLINVAGNLAAVQAALPTCLFQ